MDSDSKTAEPRIVERVPIEINDCRHTSESESALSLKHRRLHPNKVPFRGRPDGRLEAAANWLPLFRKLVQTHFELEGRSARNRGRVTATPIAHFRRNNEFSLPPNAHAAHASIKPTDHVCRTNLADKGHWPRIELSGSNGGVGHRVAS